MCSILWINSAVVGYCPHFAASIRKGVGRLARKAAKTQHRMDYAILLTVTLLCAFGLVMVFSASYYYAQNTASTN